MTEAVTFDHVSFAFDDHVVLRDVTFEIPKGSMKILLGASGAGKSVVLKLMLGLFKPDSGAIVVNGQHVERIAGRRRQIGEAPGDQIVSCLGQRKRRAPAWPAAAVELPDPIELCQDAIGAQLCQDFGQDKRVAARALRQPLI